MMVSISMWMMRAAPWLRPRPAWSEITTIDHLVTCLTDLPNSENMTPEWFSALTAALKLKLKPLRQSQNIKRTSRFCGDSLCNRLQHLHRGHRPSGENPKTLTDQHAMLLRLQAIDVAIDRASFQNGKPIPETHDRGA